MEFNLAATQELFDTGQFASISRAFTPKAAALRNLPHKAKALLAHVFAYTGRLSSAVELARSIENADGPLTSQSDAHLILGIVRKREGRIDDACTEFQVAARLAKKAGERKVLAWAQAHLFRILADGLSEPHLPALLAEVRRSVSNAGDAHLIAFLHESVAAMEAQKGRTSEAERHLRVARGLLKLRPNAWIEQLVAINASCVALIDRDTQMFERYASEGRALAAQTGHTNSDLAMDTNDAHFALLRGDFGKASALLNRILRTPKGTYVELAALESLARVALGTGQLDQCEAALDQIDQLRGARLQLAYTVRGAAALRTKLLIRRGCWVEAAALASAELSEFAAVNDAGSAVALRTLRALALAGSRELAACSEDLLDARILGVASLREHQADYYQTCGLVLSMAGAAASAALLKARSVRIWAEQGNRYGPAEAPAIEQLVDGVAKSVDGDAAEKDVNETGMDVSINCIASAFDLAYSPRLLGAELVLAIQELKLSSMVEVIETRAAASQPSKPGNRALHLGEYRGNRLTLVCSVPDQPDKAIVLSDILRLGQAAVALERAREEQRNRAALWPADPIESNSGAIFLAEEMQSILTIARRIAPTTVPVLITGETGTGKEVLARTIHAHSNRAQAPFVPFNCTSTPKDMLDSQLFGHRRGAFTGAVDNFPGVVRAAAGGTLFLDEIGDTSLEVQPKLLRFLESNEIHPIGETHPTHVDVRLIVATNVDLEMLVNQGRFREDLFYRLKIVRLHLPPLRERRVEIPTLAHYYLEKYAKEYDKGSLRLAEETMEYLVLYGWPGNVRQLANEMRRLAALTEIGAVLMPEHLSVEIAASRRTLPPSERTLEPTELVVRLDQPMAAAVKHLEQTMVRYALEKCDGRVEETAAMLGLSRKGLYLKRQRFGIESPLTTLDRA